MWCLFINGSRIVAALGERAALIATVASLGACTATIPIQNSVPHIPDETFNQDPAGTTTPAGLFGKTIGLEFETTGIRTTGSQSTNVGATAESTEIKIARTAEVFLFAHAGAERGMVFKINEDVDVITNTGYGDPKVWENTDVSYWHDWATFSGSHLTMSATMEGTSKAGNGALVMKDQTLWDIEFSSDFHSCELKRVLLKITFRTINTIQEQTLSRPIRCTVS